MTQFFFSCGMHVFHCLIHSDYELEFADYENSHQKSFTVQIRNKDQQLTGGLAQLRTTAHEVVMANHGYSPDEWLDVANMTASVLLEFIPDGKWILGIC